MWWINRQGGLYTGDCAAGDREAPADEVAARDLAQAVSDKRAKITDAFRTALARPFSYGTGEYSIDEQAQGRITARSIEATLALVTGSSWPGDGGWPTVSGQWTSMTATQFLNFAKAAAAHVTAVVRVERVLQARLAAATTIDAVQAIDPTQGWPS